MSRRSRFVALAGTALILLEACQERTLPMAPSDVSMGAVIYEHANFLGNSAYITKDVSDLKKFRGPCVETEVGQSGSTTTNFSWNDCVSSVRVAPGWRATIYRNPGYKGQSLDVVADVPNLQLVMGTCPHDGLNDCISSIRVYRP